MVLTLEMVRQNCEYPSAWNRGRLLYLQKAVSLFECKETKQGYRVAAMVQGSRKEPYVVLLLLQERHGGPSIEYQCECPAYQSMEGLCKHCVAALMKTREFFQGEEPERDAVLPEKQNPSSGSLKRILNYYTTQEQIKYAPQIKPLVHLEPVLSFAYADTYPGYPRLEVRLGEQRMYVMKHVPQFIRDCQNAREAEYGKNLRFVHTEAAFAEDSRPFLRYLEELVRSSHTMDQLFSISSADARYLTLNAYFFERLMDLSLGRELSSDRGILTVADQLPPLEIVLQKTANAGLQLSFPDFLLYRGNQHLYVLLGQTFYRCSEECTQELEPFLSEIQRSQRGAWLSGRKSERVFFLSQGDYPLFCAYILPRLERFLTVRSEVDLEDYRVREPAFHLFLDLLPDGTVSCQADVLYGDRKYDLLAPANLWQEVRDNAREAELQDVLREYFTVRQTEQRYEAVISEEEAIYRFLFEGMERLRLLGDVYLSESMKQVKVGRAPKVIAGVSVSGDLLQLELTAEGLSPQEIGEILSAYQAKKKFYRLRSGDVIRLQESGFDFLAELSQSLHLPASTWQTGTASVPKYRAAQLDAMIQQMAGEASVRRSSDFKEMMKNLKQIEDTDFEVPDGLRTTLRPYQETGYRWLCTLASYGFGGILADDMGLGKTVQMIALLAAYPGLSCIVCPASLVYNWESELHRFAPELETLILSGTQEERLAQLRSVSSHSICITSYDSLKRDVDAHRQNQYRFLVLDEAQYIKNPGTLAAKSVKCLSARHRFVLTGTPLENRLSDLWSIFDFLMPDYLYSYRTFRAELEQPIVNAEDSLALTRLQRMIRPFILRRKKMDVLKELPEKVESVFYAKMTEEQEKLYQANLARLKLRIKKESPEEFRQDRFAILAELTRLRQICCSPALCYDSYEGGSGKLETGVELLQNAVDAGHRVLVFSQFTTMLDILRSRMTAAGIPSLLLTGKDTKEQRKQTVEEFQSGNVSLFFISLKAGGTGLNLTAADMVLHYDPWWNVAAENQAADRAHRIGQTSRVTVIKLVTRDTVEERILALQERKAKLVDSVIADQSLSESTFSKEELLSILG